MTRNPYTPPDAALADPVAPHTLGSLTKWVRLSLYLEIGVLVLATVSGALEYTLLRDFQEGVYTSNEAAVSAGEASDTRQLIAGVALTLVAAISAVLVLTWIYRANRATRSLGAQNMTFTPGWSIGWYFIPVANLWKPYQAMRELWQASAARTDWKHIHVPALLPWWWFCWVVSNLFGNVSLRATLGAQELDELIAANVISAISTVTSVAVCVLLLSIVTRIDRMQAALERKDLHGVDAGENHLSGDRMANQDS